MKTKIRTEIITETTRAVIFRLERRPAAFDGEKCTKCSADLLTLNEAVRVSEIDWQKIVRLIKSSEIHSAETANGEVYICARSLFDFKS